MAALFLAGVQKQKIEQLEKEKEAVKDAKDIHDRVATDDDYRNSVRDKFR